MPQQNDIVERMNRIIIEKMHYILLNVGLLKSFCAKTTSITFYLLNCSPSNAIAKKILQEVCPNKSIKYYKLKFLTILLMLMLIMIN